MGHYHVLVSCAYSFLLAAFMVDQQERNECHYFPGKDKGKSISCQQYHDHRKQEKVPLTGKGPKSVSPIALGVINTVQADNKSSQTGYYQEGRAPQICIQTIVAPFPGYKPAVNRLKHSGT